MNDFTGVQKNLPVPSSTLCPKCHKEGAKVSNPGQRPLYRCGVCRGTFGG